MKRKVLFFIFFILSFSQKFFSQDSLSVLQINELTSKDILFRQYQEEVQLASKNQISGKAVDLNLYSYNIKPKDTFFFIASRCSIRQETLATANSIENPDSLQQKKNLVLPVQDGLFVAEKPVNTMEYLLKNQYKDELEAAPEIQIRERTFYFLANKRFTPSQRAFFLTPGFASPLENGVLTSAFGKRISPITGKWKNHKGIDLASPLGSNVYACRAGVVYRTIYSDPTYGNYIILLHSNGMQSLYAHLDTIDVKEDENVNAGSKIGTVGVSGLTTGPHLHLEIIQSGKNLDPQKYLR